ncbi:MAG TPA: phosphohistidine phosphatase SixA [Acidobacteriota bacterium]|nr:phosphohistidine phosphatase SixA [Acidobacteriota bacterium]
MNLYLLRHGIAVAADDPEVAHDRERQLTQKGSKRIRRAARGLRRLDIPLDAILTSPVLRARQTADIVAATLGLEARLEEISGLAPESTVEQLMFGLTRYQDREHLLLVGHEPLLSQTIAYLLCRSREPQLDIAARKGSLCRIELDRAPPSGPGVLHWLMSPKQLRLLGERAAKT